MIMHPLQRNLALLAVVFLLSLILWLAPTPDSDPRYPVTALAEDEVDRIVIRPTGKIDIKLVKQNQQWLITEPFKATAHPLRINALLSLLSAESHIRLPAADHALEEFGLNMPYTRIIYNEADFSFGDQHPVSNKRYLLYKQNVFLIDDIVYPLISSNPGSLINPRPIDESKTLTGIVLPKLTMQWSEPHGWSGNTGLSSNDLEILANRWHSLQASYIEYLPNKNIESAQTVELYFADSDRLSLAIINNEDETALYNTTSGIKYSLDRHTLNQLTNIL